MADESGSVGAALKGSLHIIAPFQGHSTTMDHDGDLTGCHAESGHVSTPIAKTFPSAYKAGEFPPGKHPRHVTTTPSQTSNPSKSLSNRSISAFCEECFYCPECSDNSECDSCFDQESCVDCLGVCQDCNEMDPSFSFPSAMEKPRLNCGEWTSNWSLLSTGVEASGLDLRGGQPVHTGYTAYQKACQESTFDQYVDYSASEAPETRDSIVASAASLALLPVEEQQVIDPGQVAGPGVFAGFGAQFDGASAYNGQNAFLSTPLISNASWQQRQSGGLNASVNASLRLFPAPPTLAPDQQRPNDPFAAPAIPLAQPARTICDAGTGMRLTLQNLTNAAMYPTLNLAEQTAHPKAFDYDNQLALTAPTVPMYAAPQGLLGLSSSGRGPTVYQLAASWVSPVDQPYAPAYPVPTAARKTSTGPALDPAPVPANTNGSHKAPKATTTKRCNICGAGPFDASALAKHKNSAKCQKAAGKDPVGKYACQYCKRTFPRQDQVKRHIRKVILSATTEKVPPCEALRNADERGEVAWELEVDPKTGVPRLYREKGTKCPYKMPQGYKQYMLTMYGGRHGQ